MNKQIRIILQVTTILRVYAKLNNMVLSEYSHARGHALNVIYIHDSILSIILYYRYCSIRRDYWILPTLLSKHSKQPLSNVDQYFNTSRRGQKWNLAQTDVIITLYYYNITYYVFRHCELYNIGIGKYHACTRDCKNSRTRRIRESYTIVYYIIIIICSLALT